jgi:hypothetical protein
VKAHQHQDPISLAATHNNGNFKEAFFTDKAYYMENPLNVLNELRFNDNDNHEQYMYTNF